MEAPTTKRGILSNIGPGMILAGSIVGSENSLPQPVREPKLNLISFWLIIIGCVVKVFAQIELGKNTIVNGKTSLAALNELPDQEFVFPLEKLILIQTGSYFFGQ